MLNNSLICSNGLRILALPMNQSGCMSINVFYGVGSGDEEAGRSGIAHFLEHLSFKSTLDFPAGEFDRRLRAMGASNNACTSEDFTHYYAMAPRSACEEILRAFKSMMCRLAFLSEEFEAEKLVVLEEERLSVRNSPFGQLWTNIHELAFSSDCALAPTTIGRADEVSALTREQVMEFYRRHYGPHNALVILAGDVQEADLALAQRVFSDAAPACERPISLNSQIFGKNANIEKLASEQPAAKLCDKLPKWQKKLDLSDISAATQLEYFAPNHRASGSLRSKPGALMHVGYFEDLGPDIFSIAWRIPGANDERFCDFIALARWLNFEHASPLQRIYVREKALLSDVQAYAHESRHEGWFMLFASTTQGVCAKQLAAEIAQNIQQLLPQNEQQLEQLRVFARLETAELLASPAALASELGTAYAAGDISFALRKMCHEPTLAGLENAASWLKDEIIAVLKEQK